MANESNPQAAASAALANGGMMQGETPAFPTDNDLPDHGDDIASIFGLGEEAGPVPNSPKSGSDGSASPAAPTPAAEGGGEQVTPATPPTPTTPTPAQPVEQGGQSQAPVPALEPLTAPSASPVPAQPSDAASVQALTAQVQALIAHTTQLQSQLAAQGGPQSAQPAPSGQQGQPDVDPYMDYRFGIPDDVASAIFNEDETIARNGMAHLVNSIGRIIHERVLKSVTERILPQQFQNYSQQSALTASQETMRQEYFKDFPQHNDPGIRLIVAQEAQTMWTINPTQVWDQNARNALGARVNARLGATPLQTPQPTGQVTPVPQPATMMGSSNRPQGNPADNNGDFITDVLTA